MSNNSSGDDKARLTAMLQRFKQASGATTADRATRDQLLDELQEAVGLSGRMVTENDIVRRAEKLLLAK